MIFTYECIAGEVGKITQLDIYTGEGLINREISFTLSVCREGYRPLVGDWVSVELDLDKEKEDLGSRGIGDWGDGKTNKTEEEEDGFVSATMLSLCTTAKHVAPLREWCFEGNYVFNNIIMHFKGNECCLDLILPEVDVIPHNSIYL